MARHSGPLHLDSEDVIAVESVGKRDDKDESPSCIRRARSKSLYLEKFKTASHAASPDQYVHIARERRKSVNDAQETNMETAIETADEIVDDTRVENESACELDKESDETDAVSNTLASTPPRRYTQPSDTKPMTKPCAKQSNRMNKRSRKRPAASAELRSSKRPKVARQTYNVNYIQCSVCYKLFRVEVVNDFYDEPIACSFGCGRFNACI